MFAQAHCCRSGPQYSALLLSKVGDDKTPVNRDAENSIATNYGLGKNIWDVPMTTYSPGYLWVRPAKCSLRSLLTWDSGSWPPLPPVLHHIIGSKSLSCCSTYECSSSRRDCGISYMHSSSTVPRITGSLSGPSSACATTKTKPGISLSR